ncbi:MAG: fibronectin type III domain-containing protein [Oscillospiraceae bacterium]
MKKIISICCAMAILASGMVSVFSMSAAAATTPKATTVPFLKYDGEGESPYKTGNPVPVDKVAPGDAALTAVFGDPLTNLVKLPSVKLQLKDAAKDNWSNIPGADIKLNVNTAKNKALLIYVKTDISQAYSHFLGMGVKLPDGKEVWPGLGRDATLQCIKTGETEWKDITTWYDSGSKRNGFDLPKGFEGYLSVPFSAISAKGAESFTWQEDSTIIALTLQPMDYSVKGAKATAHHTYGSFMLCDQDKMSGTTVMLDADTTEKDLFKKADGGDTGGGDTGGGDTGDKGEVTGIMNARLDDILSGYEVGTALLDKGPKVLIGEPKNGKESSVKVCESPVGLTKMAGIEINNEDTVSKNGHVVGDHYVILKSSTALTGSKAIMFYVKMPAGVGNGIYFNPTVSKDGAKAWPRAPKGANVQLLKKGNSIWEETKCASEGTIWLGEGFEGYVRIPLSSISILGDGTAFELTADYQIDEYNLRADYYGGTVGSFSVGPFMVCTNDVMSFDGVSIDGKKIQNLFTGAEMSKEDLKPSRPIIGSVLKDLPEATSGKMINIPEESDITISSIRLTWEKTDAAKSYRVDLYQSELGADGTLAYKYVATKDATDEQVTVDGLDKGVRYYAVVTALDAAGNDISVYANISFTTSFGDSGDGGFDFDDDYGDGSDNVYDEEFPVMGSAPVVIPLMLLMGVSAAGAYAFKKKKQNP